MSQTSFNGASEAVHGVFQCVSANYRGVSIQGDLKVAEECQMVSHKFQICFCGFPGKISEDLIRFLRCLRRVARVPRDCGGASGGTVSWYFKRLSDDFHGDTEKAISRG